MGLDENKAVAQRLYDELFNRGSLSAVDELVAADCVCHAAPSGTPVGPRGMRRIAARLRDAFPDGRFVLEDLIAEDDRVAVRLMFRGTRRDAKRTGRPTARHVEREQVACAPPGRRSGSRALGRLGTGVIEGRDSGARRRRAAPANHEHRAGSGRRQRGIARSWEETSMEQRGAGPLRPLARGALVALGWFVVALIVPNVAQRTQYDALRQAGSQLALGTGGWLLTVGFCGLGIGTLLVAWLIRRTAPEARAVPPLLAVAGALQFVAAVSPTDANGAPLTTHGLVHNLAGLVSFLLYVAAMVVAGFSFRASPAWRSFTPATTVWSICAVVSLLLTFILGGLGFFGLGERIALAALLSWLVAVAWRVQTRVSLGTSAPSEGRSDLPEPEGRRS